MSRRVTVDLDDADDVARVWAQFQHVAAVRQADPELRAAVLGAVARLELVGRLGSEDAERIRAELDEVTPAIVLASNWRQIVDDRPALGHYLSAFPSRERMKVDLAEFYRQEPTRLSAVVQEMARFGGDTKKIVDAVIVLADRAGIEPVVADGVISESIRHLRQRRSSVG